jgi:hypothetical protein
MIAVKHASGATRNVLGLAEIGPATNLNADRFCRSGQQLHAVNHDRRSCPQLSPFWTFAADLGFPA